MVMTLSFLFFGSWFVRRISLRLVLLPHIVCNIWNIISRAPRLAIIHLAIRTEEIQIWRHDCDRRQYVIERLK